MTRALVALAAALTAASPALAAPAGEKPPSSPPSGQAPQSAQAAQPGASAPKPSPAADRVARALTTQKNWNETLSEYASSLSSQISGALKSQGGDAPANVEPRVRAGLEKAAPYDEVVRLQAQALAGRFSEDELRAIEKFYESGTGKKLVSELPAISRQVIEVVQGRISAAVPRIVQEVAPSLARAKPSPEEGTAPDAAAPNAQGRKPPAQTPPPRK
jgi:hypothetical protein